MNSTPANHSAVQKLECGREKLIVELDRLIRSDRFDEAHLAVEKLRGLRFAFDVLSEDETVFEEHNRHV